MEFSRPEYWSGLLCPPPGNLPNSDFKPGSPALPSDFKPGSPALPSEPPGKPLVSLLDLIFLRLRPFNSLYSPY